jgi:hypothetical protein
MRYLLTIILALKLGLASGQDFVYPIVKNSGRSISSFIPKGWILLDSAWGDLNNDKNNDIAFIIQHQDSISLTKIDEGFTDTVITQPRILIVAFYNITTKQYDLIEQSNTFILNHDNPNMEEPFQDISISGRVLKIDFEIFMNAGGWGMSNNSYKFRFQNNQFYLIGADYNSANRATGDTEDRSYNFLTKKVKIITGNFSEDNNQIVKSRSFTFQKMKTLKTFTQPFTWKIEEDFYL